eukprot:6197662-Pleurochrysis_carterae.AAC.1
MEWCAAGMRAELRAAVLRTEIGQMTRDKQGTTWGRGGGRMSCKWEREMKHGAVPPPKNIRRVRPQKGAAWREGQAARPIHACLVTSFNANDCMNKLTLPSIAVI